MNITIGKAKDNDFVVDDPHVSRHHAALTYTEEQRFQLEDFDSSNGTFVNGNQIAKKIVAPTDEIVLGKDYRLDMAELLHSQNDYAEEFNQLESVYANYSAAKVKVQSSNIFKTRILQMLPFAMVGVVGVILGFLGKGSPVFFIISLSITILAPTLGIYMAAKQSAKTPERLQELANQFKIDYVCPKCGTFLGEIPWESLRNKKQCPVASCRAKWVHE